LKFWEGCGGEPAEAARALRADAAAVDFVLRMLLAVCLLVTSLLAAPASAPGNGNAPGFVFPGA
jgi:hypothetical protein